MRGFSTSLLLVAFLVACNAREANKPVVVITAPASETLFREGDIVEIEIIADDARAVRRIQFYLDGNLLKTQTAPAGEDQPTFTVLFLWQAIAGRHTFVARAFNAAGQSSESAAVVAQVLPADARALPEDTPSTTPSLVVSPTRAVSPAAGITSAAPTFAGATATAAPQVDAACNGAPTLSTFTVTTEQITEGATTRIQWGLVTNAGSVQIDPGIGAVETPGYRDVSPRITTTYTLTARCGASVKTAQVTILVNPAGSGIANFAGTWVHNFGTLSIIQAGVNVFPTSEYTNAFASKKGFLNGTVVNNTLSGTWTIESTSGNFQFFLGSDGNSFDGSWTSGQQQLRWCGARPGSAFPSGCSFAGIWNIALLANPTCASMSLGRVDNAVTGNLCGLSVNGIVKHESSETVLNGTVNMGGGSNPFTLYTIGGFNSMQFRGSWGDNPINEWCGWRGNAPKPSPCGK